MTFKERIALFWAEVHALEEKYRVELDHEDSHGSFLLRETRLTEGGVQQITAYGDGQWFHWRDAKGGYGSGSYEQLLKALDGVEP